jgi:FkbM family methyltransferase
MDVTPAPGAAIPGGQLVGGVWLPATEVHLREMMLDNPKARLIREGKATYQIRKLDAVMRYLPLGRRRVAVDIGAHVGLWSMWLVELFARVEAFEPVPLHRELFRANVTGDYCLHACALGESDGTVDLEVPEQTTGNAHIAIGRRHPGTKHVADPDRHTVIRGVPICTLDRFGLEAVDLVKIDVEGYERAVVRGARETLARWSPVVIVEQKGNDAAYGDAPDAALAELEALGYVRQACLSGDWIMVKPS